MPKYCGICHCLCLPWKALKEEVRNYRERLSARRARHRFLRREAKYQEDLRRIRAENARYRHQRQMLLDPMQGIHIVENPMEHVLQKQKEEKAKETPSQKNKEEYWEAEEMNVVENPLADNTGALDERIAFAKTRSGQEKATSAIPLSLFDELREAGEKVSALPSHLLQSVLDNEKKLDMVLQRRHSEVLDIDYIDDDDDQGMAALVQQRLAENQAMRGEAGSGSDPELTQYLEDERIALFLQNQEFMEELRRSRDFMTALEQDALESPGEEPLAHKGHLDDAAFRERLRNMGKASRKKFAQMARVFTRTKKKGAKHILSRGEAPSRDHLLLTAEPLLMEEEEEFRSDPKAQDLVSPNDVSSSPRGKDII